ncbi:MAG: M48 family metalloprotease [bacterium]
MNKKLLSTSFFIFICVIQLSAWPDVGVDIPVDIPGPVGDYLAIAQDINEALQVFAEGYTPEQEYYLGRTCAANILNQYQNKTTENDQLSMYVNEIGQSLAVMSQADRDDLFSGFIFIVVEGSNKNAIATPGGFIFITTGMIEACENEDQIAAILAHEIGHVIHKDAVNSIDSKQRLISLIKLAEEYGGPAAKQKAQEALDKLPDWFVDEIINTSTDEIFSTIVDGMMGLWENAYNQDQEKAADIYAVHLMTKTGYNPYELINIIGKLNEGVGDHYGAHPSPEERVNYISTEIATLATYPQTLPVRTERVVK